VRWASDTSGGVLERPADAVTARERSRWEVPAISWTAALGPPDSAAAAGSAGLAVLLRGPQGVSAGPDHLGVSLLRGPTWPDPSADNGPQRQTVALMPCPGGWRAAGVPEQALRLREPLWLRPASAAPEGAAAPAAAGPPPPALPPLGEDLQLIALTADPSPGVVRLAVQNLGPCRRRLTPGPGWRVLEVVDGLHGAPMPAEGAPEEIRPWALRFFRVQRIVA
jgi:alpha-mannosidase